MKIINPLFVYKYFIRMGYIDVSGVILRVNIGPLRFDINRLKRTDSNRYNFKHRNDFHSIIEY